MSPTSRRPLAAAVAVGLLAAVPAVSATVSPASAATTTTTVAYDRCDVRTVANDPNSRVKPVFSWRPTVKVDLSTPVKMNDDVMVRVDISDFPADQFPGSLSDTYAYYYMYATSSSGGTHSFGKTMGLDFELPAGESVPLGESEDDYEFTKPGLVAWYADQFTMNVEGWDGPNGTGTWRRYYVKCDKPETAQKIAEIPVWDPAAKAALALSSPTVTQGRTVTLTGSGFRPDEGVRFAIDDKVLDTKATSLIGSASYPWTAGAFLKPGVHKVALSSTISNKSVTGTVTVVAARASAVVKPKKVKRGKKITVNGAQFMPGESVSVVLKRTAGGKGLKSKSFGSVKAASNGTLKKKLKVAKKFGKGKHAVVLTGATSQRTGTAKVTVKVPKKK
jgi:hypothetical protein